MYKKIYVPVDNSDYSMRSIEIAMHLAKEFGSELIGSHAYAAKMHDVRFRQMEFTLPDEYQVEEALEKQRDIHDTLITMGLELISDSYLQIMKKKCDIAKIPFESKMMDGKNYQVLVNDINKNDYDLVILGALGMGAVRESIIGSVCERLVRRVKSDTFIVKNTSPLKDQLTTNSNEEVKHEAGNGGNIIVCLDGSPESFAGLKKAITLGKALDKEVEAIAVYDPYFHYSMFSSLSNILTEKAARVFKFKEQEKLHEDVIDTGLAKIYQSHLEVARQIAKEEDYDLKTTLLDGKAFEKIMQYVRSESPWLLVMGRIGVHSNEDMDIGSNVENILRLAPCNILLSSQRYIPSIDLRADESMNWTAEATVLLNTAPKSVRGIARTTVHRYAMERGHSVISKKIIEEAMSNILPPKAMQAMGIVAKDLAIKKLKESATDTYVCRECGYASRDVKPVACPVCGADNEKFQKIDKEAIESLGPKEGDTVEETTFDNLKLKWTSKAKEALRTVPSGYQRRRVKAQIEKTARVRKLPSITEDMVLKITGNNVESTQNHRKEENIKDGDFYWTVEAFNRLQRIPEGFMRDGSKKQMENVARDRNTDLITIEISEEGTKKSLKVMEKMITD